MRKSYIGITDFSHADQVHEMLDVFKGTDRVLMVGIMMSYKTLNGIMTKWQFAWPKNEKIKTIFTNRPKAYNTLHYADYENKFHILQSLEQATKLGGPYMNAIQLDMIWPDPEAIKAYRKNHPDIDIILQVNAKALDMVGNDPAELIRKLCLYDNSLSYVLLDKSMGKGLGMDAEVLVPFLRALTCSIKLPDLGLAVAGGLGPDTLHLVKPIVEEFPLISIDAQGRLRPSGNALDPIDWSMAKEYLKQAVEMFK